MMFVAGKSGSKQVGVRTWAPAEASAKLAIGRRSHLGQAAIMNEHQGSTGFSRSFLLYVRQIALPKVLGVQ